MNGYRSSKANNKTKHRLFKFTETELLPSEEDRWVALKVSAKLYAL